MNTRTIPQILADEPRDLTNTELTALAKRLERTVIDLEGYGEAFSALAGLLRYRLRTIYDEQDKRQRDLEWDDLTMVDIEAKRVVDLGKTIRDELTLCGVGL